jgi:hypothetical protein
MTRKFKSKPLFKKRKLPGGFRLPKPEAVRPSKPLPNAPPLPFTDEAQDEANRHFAKAAIRAMRERHQKEEL